MVRSGRARPKEPTAELPTHPAAVPGGSMSRRALVTGAAGQDGWYLTRLLRDRGY
jgi:hypothetical protein